MKHLEKPTHQKLCPNCRGLPKKAETRTNKSGCPVLTPKEGVPASELDEWLNEWPEGEERVMELWILLNSLRPAISVLAPGLQRRSHPPPIAPTKREATWGQVASNASGYLGKEMHAQRAVIIFIWAGSKTPAAERYYSAACSRLQARVPHPTVPAVPSPVPNPNAEPARLWASDGHARSPHTTLGTSGSSPHMLWRHRLRIR